MSTPVPTICILLLILLLPGSQSIPLSAISQHKHDASLSYSERQQRCLLQRSLICVIRPTAGYTTRGTVRFMPHFGRDENGVENCLVRIRGELRGLSEGRHGFHIHSFGDVSKMDGSSTGGHMVGPEVWSGGRHGFPTNSVRHWGDLGNLFVGADGRGKYNRVDGVIKLQGILGRGITVHQGADRGPLFQPSGGAGERVGVCVIGVANDAIMG